MKVVAETKESDYSFVTVPEQRKQSCSRQLKTDFSCKVVQKSLFTAYFQGHLPHVYLDRMMFSDAVL